MNKNEDYPQVGDLYESEITKGMIVVIKEIYEDKTHEGKDIQKRIKYHVLFDTRPRLEWEFDLSFRYFNSAYHPLKQR